MFKERYQKLHNSIVPDETMISNVIRRAQQYECKQRLSGWQRGLCAAAAIICVMPLAAASSTGYQVMYAVSPQATQFFTPVQRADEDQGIRMEVESASVHGNTVEVYVSFQDLEGSRIDGTTDLYDSYSLGRPFSSAGGCLFYRFDEETGKAGFLISDVPELHVGVLAEQRAGLAAETDFGVVDEFIVSNSNPVVGRALFEFAALGCG